MSFTAQTALASSYGLLQVLYTTALERLRWAGVNGAKNPHYLFDMPANINAGAGIVKLAAQFLSGAFGTTAVSDQAAFRNRCLSMYQRHERPVGLRALHIDGDGKPEVIVDSTQGSHTRMNVFKWNGAELNSIDPIDELGHSPYIDAILADIDSDGRMEIIDRPQDERLSEDPDSAIVESRSLIYRLVNGKYATAGEYVLSVGIFVRDSGQPKNEPMQLRVKNPGPGYRLRVLNGGMRLDLPRVSSASLALNGVEIAGPSRFSPTTRSFEIPMTLPSFSTLNARLAGPPGGVLMLLVFPVAAQ